MNRRGLFSVLAGALLAPIAGRNTEASESSSMLKELLEWRKEQDQIPFVFDRKTVLFRRGPMRQALHQMLDEAIDGKCHIDCLDADEGSLAQWVFHADIGGTYVLLSRDCDSSKSVWVDAHEMAIEFGLKRRDRHYAIRRKQSDPPAFHWIDPYKDVPA